jgi:hypothetical protein
MNSLTLFATSSVLTSRVQFLNQRVVAAREIKRRIAEGEFRSLSMVYCDGDEPPTPLDGPQLGSASRNNAC